MNGDAVGLIQQGAAKPSVFQIGGRNYIVAPTGDGRYNFLGDKGTQESGPLLALPQAQPAIPTLAIHTLDGFADYVKAAVTVGETEAVLDRLGVASLAVHVVNEETVELITKLDEDYPQRDVVVRSSFVPLIGSSGTRFEFGKFMGLETFVIALQALFTDLYQRGAVLQVIGNIRDERVAAFGDDGISQEVVLRAGVARNVASVVPNPVILAPYRTFREVSQPPSPFVLRVKAEEGEQPKVALFEADGGAWRLEAISLIKAYLVAKLPTNLTVLA